MMLHLVSTFCIVLAATAAGPAEPVADQVYEELLAMPAPERARAVAEMPPATQSAVWTRHFIDTLILHPEFTTDQRAAIQEALRLMTPEFFAIEPSDPRWTERVDEPLRRLRAQVMKVFPDKRLAREILTQIGPSAVRPERPAKPSADRGAEGSRRRVTTNADNAPDCTCSVVSDYCDWGALGTIAEVRCRNAWCNLSIRGCGTLARYACEGLCFIVTS